MTALGRREVQWKLSQCIGIVSVFQLIPAGEAGGQDVGHLVKALIGGHALGVEGVGHYAKPLGAILTMANLKQ